MVKYGKNQLEKPSMSVLSDYTADEQTLLLRSLAAAAIAISAASPGRKVETASEGFAAAQYIMEVRKPYLATPLIGSVQYAIESRAAADQSFPDFVKAATAAGAGQSALDTLAAVAALLDAKTTPEEALAFKHWLLDIATTTTEAGKEGGNFLGWGAVAVNDEERAALQQIAEVLGVSAT
jgi:hypothetical protein